MFKYVLVSSLQCFKDQICPRNHSFLQKNWIIASGQHIYLSLASLQSSILSWHRKIPSSLHHFFLSVYNMVLFFLTIHMCPAWLKVKTGHSFLFQMFLAFPHISDGKSEGVNLFTLTSCSSFIIFLFTILSLGHSTYYMNLAK